MSTKKQNSALLILGMHRSGTSALTGVLAMAGADPGPSLIPGVEGVNPKGFWEHSEIVAIHERLLATLGSSWDDCRPLPVNWWERGDVSEYRCELIAVLQRDFGHSPLWILKDPRLCRLLPLWLEILNDFGATPHFVICLRLPQEVAASLTMRDGIPSEMANLSWLTHLIESERWTRDAPRVLITYEQLLADWQSVVQRVAQDLSLQLRPDAEAASRIDAFLEPALRHHASNTEASPNLPLVELAVTAYRAATHASCDQLANAMEPFEAAISPYVQQIAPWETYLHVLRIKCQQIPLLQADIAHLELTNQNLTKEVYRVKATASWRVTAPLRAVWNVLKRPGGKRQSGLP